MLTTSFSQTVPRIDSDSSSERMVQRRESFWLFWRSTVLVEKRITIYVSSLVQNDVRACICIRCMSDVFDTPTHSDLIVSRCFRNHNVMNNYRYADNDTHAMHAHKVFTESLVLLSNFLCKVLVRLQVFSKTLGML